MLLAFVSQLITCSRPKAQKWRPLRRDVMILSQQVNSLTVLLESLEAESSTPEIPLQKNRFERSQFELGSLPCGGSIPAVRSLNLVAYLLSAASAAHQTLAITLLIALAKTLVLEPV